MRTAAALAAAAALSAGACARPEPAAKAPVRVAAAADLARAFGELGPAFEKASGRAVTFSFGSSGLLSKQIAEGAPFDAYFSANVAFAEEVARKGACEGASMSVYARGKIGIWSKSEPVASLADLADPRFKKIAVANPEHAPYGRAAKEAITAAGLWEKVEPRLVYGENVQQTLQYAQTGNAEAAIVALSLGIAQKDGQWVLVDSALHAPLDQASVVCTRGSAKEGGAAFTAFVGSATGREIMRRYGFASSDREQVQAE